MVPWNPKANEVFLAAVEQPPDENRNAYLEAACGDDTDLRSQVLALLAANESAGSFLAQPPAELLGTMRFDQLDNETVNEGEERLLSEFLSPCDTPGRIGMLGPYEVLDVVGRGGMGIVLRAHDGKLNRVVAIKVMLPELAANPAAVRRFLREAQAAAAVSHNHVVTIHAVDDSQRLPFLVMEFVDGQSLQSKIEQDGALQLRETLRIGMQVAAGLAAAHKQGLIHRDVKPANILLENSIERVKITDFGLARGVDDACVTQTGMVAGTPQYMSPEQARGEPVDHRSDLFSLGSVLYAMCVGTPPFRASTTLGVLRGVSDDTPRPIKALNPEVPDWLVSIVDKLLAKNPSERFQSAAEVADLLGQYLAHQQQPSAVRMPESLPVQLGTKGSGAGGRSSRRHRLVAAAVIFLLVGSLGLTEATGVTQVAEFLGTVLRITTPDGTLVVEADDPQVEVTIEGDGGIKITGAGPQEVRLRPGSYRLLATKDGKAIRNEIITIIRGGRQVVQVSLEADAPGTTEPATKSERQAFAVLGGPDVADRKFDTLSEAVLRASDGDTIEVRGNGPFISQPINIGSHSLVIRAGEGFRPVIKLSPEGARGDAPLLFASRQLVLEGLELQRNSPLDWKPGKNWLTPCIVISSESPVHIANCRFLLEGTSGYLVWGADSAVMVASNCEFLGDSDTAVAPNRIPMGARGSMDNCVQIGGAAMAFTYWRPDLRNVSIHLRRNTIVQQHDFPPSIDFVLHVMPTLPNDDRETKPIHVEASENVVDSRYVLGFHQYGDFIAKQSALEPPEAEAMLLRLFNWQGRRNLYAANSAYLAWLNDFVLQPAHGPQSAQDWTQFWGADETGSFEGHIRFQGGNLRSRLTAAPGQLTPEDFRLRPDSAGYRAGPDGKDLGADIDLVGPGKAYERWKKTPEYRQWLKDTGQMK